MENKTRIFSACFIVAMLLFVIVVNSGDDSSHSDATSGHGDQAKQDQAAVHEKQPAPAEVTHAEAKAAREVAAHAPEADTHKAAAMHSEKSQAEQAKPKTKVKHGAVTQPPEADSHKVAAVHPEKAPSEKTQTVQAKPVKKDETHEAITLPAEEDSHKAAVLPPETNPFEKKPSPDKAIQKLLDGNERFIHGESIHPHLNLARLKQARTENQGDHAYATVITCSDSRVPVEAIFDAGIMDIFVIRVAGNVCDVDERGSIEYGLAHVNTPVLVVLGHTQCGAVTAVTQAVLGIGHPLERNIPPLVDNIQPAVEKAMADNPDIKGTAIIPLAIEENVWTGIEELFMESPSTREFISKGYAKVLGAIYDVGSGSIQWLPEAKTLEILKKVEANPAKAVAETKAKEAHHG